MSHVNTIKSHGSYGDHHLNCPAITIMVMVGLAHPATRTTHRRQPANRAWRLFFIHLNPQRALVTPPRPGALWGGICAGA